MLSCLFLSAMCGLGAAQATTYTVDTTSDNGGLSACTVAADDCSLRGAISNANGNAGADIITFDTPVFNTATTIALSTVLPHLTENVTISGPGKDFLTVRAVSGKYYEVFVIFTLNAGIAADISGLTIFGTYQGIDNAGTLALSNSAFVSCNTGLDNKSTGTATVKACTFTTNFYAPILNSGTLYLSNSSLTDNRSGYGLLNRGVATVTNSTFSGQNYGVGNEGTLSISSCTITGNLSDGIINEGPLTLSNSIVTGNTANNIRNVNSNVVINGGTNLIAGDSMLGPLQDNGGPTYTHALLPYSPAIDAGNSPLTTDQRGLARPSGLAADIGAFEVQAPTPSPTPTPSPSPAVSISDVVKSEGNTGSTTFDFTATLSTSSTQSVSVNYATQNGTAIAGGSVPFDYTSRTGTLTFLPGQTSRNVSVIVRGDLYSETDDTFFVNLSNATGGASIAKAQGVGTITNDDGSVAPALTVADAHIAEGNSGTKSLIFTFTLNKPSETPINVNYATGYGNATAGNMAPADYSARSGVLTFAPNQTSRTVAITIYGDTRVEQYENFNLNLSNVQGATMLQSYAVGIIDNDD